MEHIKDLFPFTNSFKGNGLLKVRVGWKVAAMGQTCPVRFYVV